jgi:predicted acetyltransferase
MDVDIRTIEPDEFDAYAKMLSSAFSGEFRPDELEMERKVAEFDRMLAAYDGPEIVGGASAASFQMTAPGSVLPTAGVTAVGVRPTHRRRGVTTALMRRQLEDVHERGEPLAALYASEGGIYGRFGYGLASFSGSIDIERDRTAFVRGYRPSGRVILMERDLAMDAIRSVYDEIRPGYPGMIERSPGWWDVRFHDPEQDRDGASPYFYAVHQSGGEFDAYVVYRVKHDWPNEVPANELRVEELLASTAQAYADMWRYVFDVDLIARIKSWNRPADDPLLWMLAEPRRLRLMLREGLWVRLVDVPEALGGRRYPAAGRVSFEVRDSLCPWNDGRYELEGGPEGAECRPTAGDADLVLTVTDLGATYLGGTRFRSLAQAGRVAEETPGAIGRADAMFAGDRAPWCAHMF